MIRPASHADVAAIVGLAKQAWSESPAADIPQDDAVLQQTARNCIQRPDCYLRVLEVDGQVRGAIAGAIGPAPGLRGEVATDVLFYVEHPFRGRGLWLLRGFIRWAFNFKSVQYVWLQISIGGEDAAQTEHFYQQLGLHKAGACFIARRSV